MKQVTAYANANIALVKYWGKNDLSLNIPAVSSLSMTLDGLGTTTTISKACRPENQLTINGLQASIQALTRTNDFLGYFQKQFALNDHLSITTRASVPYAAGLASSASYFASLSMALNEYFSLGLKPEPLAELARIGSASAARSIFGGFVGLISGVTSCETVPLSVHEGLDLVMVIAICDERQKKISSREAMKITQATSPYFKAFVASSQADYDSAVTALKNGTLAALGQIMEHSTLKMHAAMWAACPAVNYLSPKTLEIMALVYELRSSARIDAYFTMDAGPNVKILCERKASADIAHKLKNDLGISKIHLSQPGAAAHIVSQGLV